MMTMTQFENLIAAYGSKPENWPQDQSRAMQDFHAAHTDAQAIVERAKWLDAALDMRGQAPGSDLEARILRDMNDTLASGDVLAFPQHREMALGRASLWAGVSAMAACFVGGFIAAPVVIDAFTGGADLLASLDIISETFLPTEPL